MDSGVKSLTSLIGKVSVGGGGSARAEEPAPGSGQANMAAVNGEPAQEAAPTPSKRELYEQRVKDFEAILEGAEKRVDVAGLRQLAIGGVPDHKGNDLRARTWKVLLGYLPRDRDAWAEVLREKRQQYAGFCEEFLVDPAQMTSGEGDATGRNREGSLSTSQVDDDPLSTKSDSVWNKYFADNEVKDQIARDVERTHPDIGFFNNQDGSSDLHKECMRRSLFVFAKLNPGLAYVQGMNELLAPLLWTFKTDPDPEQSAHAEADAFFCFIEIMSEFRDHFCKQLDNSDSGIKATMTRLLEYLQLHDYELWDHLTNRVKIDPQYFAFRWITLMLTQEFHFPDLVRLWDTFLADPKGRLDSLLRFCVTMLVSARDMLLAGDFASNLKLLQSYPPTDVSVLLRKSAQFEC